MIEEIIRNFLSSVLSIPVFMEIPARDIPERYVIIQKTGGGEAEFLRSATLAIQSYAPSRYEASQVNEDVKAAMRGAIALGEISGCKLNNDYDFTNTATKQYRYQAIYNIHHY